MCDPGGDLSGFRPPSCGDLYDRFRERAVYHDRGLMSAFHSDRVDVPGSCNKHSECDHLIICNNAVNRTYNELPI